MFRNTAAAILLCAAVLTAHSQPAEMDSWSEINWTTGEMVINVETRFEPGSEGLRMRNNSEEYFKKNFFNVFMESIKQDRSGQLYFNSSDTIESKIQQAPDILYNIDEIYNRIVKVYSVYNQDMAGMRMQYKLDIYRDIGRFFIKHTMPASPEKRVIWTPSSEYTGLVIYAAGEYPVHGENRKAVLNPALYPAVYDEKMRKICSMEMVDPLYLEEWGNAAYFSDPDDPGIAERAGEKPLYTMARKLYGRYRTDILIPSSDADRILYRGRNERMIREGRVAVIYSPPSAAP